VQRTKAELRAAILMGRREVPPHEHDVEARALAHHVSVLVSEAQTVCAYVPVAFEPGSMELIDSLHRRGARVLLPVARNDGGVPQPLQWGEYRPGELVEAGYGLREPGQPLLGPDAVGEASVILVPALAVDRTGVRLGRGAGFYDRSLPLADTGARLIAVVRDEELVDRLPAEPHDVRMTHALTPHGGLVSFGRQSGMPVGT
jgi:5-formyltetrahydrofolate cyclo-ligase